MPTLDRDRALGALLGAAAGDALGMPVDGLSHQNVRLYYKGIKGYTADEKRGEFKAGQGTAHTRRLFALARALTAERNAVAAVGALFREELGGRAPPFGMRSEAADSSAAVAASPVGVLDAALDLTQEDAFEVAVVVLGTAFDDPSALAAAAGQAFAVAEALRARPTALDGPAFVNAVADRVAYAERRLRAGSGVSERLRPLALHLDEVPLDLQDRCNGTGDAADEAFPFAVAMFARNPALVEATLLSAVNVGGAAGAVGAMTGALLGAFNGWDPFPAEWRDGLEDVGRLEAEAMALVDALG